MGVKALTAIDIFLLNARHYGRHVQGRARGRGDKSPLVDQGARQLLVNQRLELRQEIIADSLLVGLDHAPDLPNQLMV